MRTSASPRASAGFTYIGMLLFLAVFGAISAGVVSSGAAISQRAAEEELLWVGTQFRDAVRSYYEAGAGGRRFALTLPELLRDPRFPGVRRHLRRIYPDPLTGAEDWGIVQAPGGGIMGVYSKAPGRPLKLDQFPVEFATFTNKDKYADWVFAYVPPGMALPGATPGTSTAQPPATQPTVSVPRSGASIGASPSSTPQVPAK